MRTQVSNLFRQTAAALMMATFLSPTVWAAPAQSGRPQKLASLDAVPDGLSAPDWSSIRQQYEQHRHAVLPIPNRDGYQARNPGQQWQTRFDGRGFTVTPKAASAERDRSPVAAGGTEGTVSECPGGFLFSVTAAPGDRSRSGASAPAWQWGLELKSYGFPGHERAVAGQPRVNTAGQRVTYDWDATLQEWFVNDRRGLEHGFTVRERPTVTDDAVAPAFNSQLSTLNFLLAVRGGLHPEVQADGRGVRFVDAQGAAALTYSELTVLDADGRKLPARFEAVGSRRSDEADDDAQRAKPVRLVTSAATESLRLVIDERGARYPLTIDPIAQQAYLKASNTDEFDEFGVSVAVSGNTVVVGAWIESSSATGVDGDQSDDTAEAAGAAYIFVRNGTTWRQQAYLKASNTDSRDYFGRSVAISGDTVVVGAYGEDSSATGVDGDGSDNSTLFAGPAYVFVRSGTNWTQQAYLKASNTRQEQDANGGIYGQIFGQSVAVSGNTVVVGAPQEFSNATGVNGNQNDTSAPFAGAAYVFVRNATNWTQQDYLKASNTASNQDFGRSVAVSGDTVVVGSPGEAGWSGASYVFVRNGTNWTQQAFLKASNTEADDAFGWSVAISGDTVVVGAFQEDSSTTGVNGDGSNNSALGSGAAYIFARNGTIWNQQAFLKASNTGGDLFGGGGYNGDHFGNSVAVSGNTVMVGAGDEDSSTSGVNGNQSNNSLAESGAAYIFVRDGTTWSQQAYLKASNTGLNDQFGFSVSVSGNTGVVGAYLEESNATGVNGNQSNNSAGYAGAAYVFTGLGIGPRLAVERDGSGGYFLRFTGAPDVTYRLQRAPSVTGPWSALATNTAPASGLIEYHETTPPPGAAFYRTAQP